MTAVPEETYVVGVAGASAARQHERRRARDEQRVRAAHPRTAGIRLLLRDDPQHVVAWEDGARGEQRVGRMLDGGAGPGRRVLHDRRIPGSRANIDHLAVTCAGVHIVDAKLYTGRVEVRSAGVWSGGARLLVVNGRDRTKLVEGVHRQVEAVARVVGDDLPLHPWLCFVGVESFGFFERPRAVEGVRVGSPRDLERALGNPGPLDEQAIAEIAGLLERQLRAA